MYRCVETVMKVVDGSGRERKRLKKIQKKIESTNQGTILTKYNIEMKIKNITTKTTTTTTS